MLQTLLILLKLKGITSSSRMLMNIREGFASKPSSTHLWS
ncbi:hypothetical protein Gotri_018878, partial [Gossypium trilobum]|nr:hypothetical protein [Gossypium trilobum]